MHWVPNDAYRVRNATALSIASHGYVPALRQRPISLSRSGCIRIPGVSHRLDRASTMRLSTRNLLTSSSSVREARYTGQSSSPEQEGVSVSPAISSPPTDAPILIAYGLPRRFALVQNWLHETAPPPDQFDRNIRAFGGEIQRVLGDLHIAVVGCGGTGSAVTEQLVRSAYATSACSIPTH